MLQLEPTECHHEGKTRKKAVYGIEIDRLVSDSLQLPSAQWSTPPGVEMPEGGDQLGLLPRKLEVLNHS